MQVNGPLCGGCPLEQKGTIFIPFDGLGTNKVMLVGDSGWIHESITLRNQSGNRVGTPFSGPSGWFIERQLKRLGASRNDFTVANTYWCKAPHLGYTDHPERYPDAALALEHCRPYLDELISRMQPKAIVPLGNVALRRIAGVSGIEKHQGYYLPTPYGIPAIPTFHPSYIMKGQQKLSGVWCMAVQRALDVAKKGEKPKQYDLLLDPPLQVAMEYLTQYNDLLVCDIETPNTDDNEEESEDASYTIVRISFSNLPGTAISLPWQPPFVRLCQEVLDGAKTVVFWNQRYDLPRLKANGCTIHGKVVDAMFAWHFLQSDLPKALGFVAPLFLCLEPWKHLSSENPPKYSALDSAITMDLYLAIKAKLEEEGRWAAFERHCTRVFPLLEEMSRAGVMLDREYQQKFKTRLEGERDEKLAQLQEQVPASVKPTKTYKRQPKDMTDVAPLEVVLGHPEGWVRMLPFNPGSPLQVKRLIQHFGLPVPKAKGEDRETTEAKHLKRLAKKNGVFQLILDYRERAKLIDSYMWEVQKDGRVHTTFSFHPSTWRKSARNPAIQTVPKRSDLAADFRRTVIASPGHLLVECDSSAIEAVLTGFYAGSQDVMRLAKSGIHGWMVAGYHGTTIPLDSSDADLARRCKEAKAEWGPQEYDRMKRVVYLSFYMGTPQRIHEEYPLDFASVKQARELQEFLFSTKPGQDIRKWQQQTMQQAHKEHYLEIPWKYRHYFYEVFRWDGRTKDWKLGEDAKRAVAFRPQATASAIQTEFLLDIADNHPDMLGGLRWIIHDAIVAEVKDNDAERYAQRLRQLMTRPFAELGGLAIGAEVKAGKNLRDMEVQP